MIARSQRFSLALLCLGILCTSTHRASAQTADAWLYVFRGTDCRGIAPPAAMGISIRTDTPGSAIMGHLPPAGTVGEVAVTQSIISVGDDVPLPTYADGTLARESEVFWTVQLWYVEFPLACGLVRYLGDYAVANFNGRRLAGATAQIEGGINIPPATDLRVLVNVVAVRSSATTSVKRPSLGEIKARYR